MFKLIDTLMRMLGGAPRVRLGEPADGHVEAYWDHVDRQIWQQEEAEWVAARAAREAEWNALPEAEREAVIAWCDDRNAEGRLEDHRFYAQWLALRMQGYVGD
ncbi:hypothetical protein [Caulobacter sp. FWC26]|uniref:hypothetical protein n=1 Tax=Caulobacter sp. FWC26 TaxID=69665 RepID=UPI000C14B68E|nr:hypothetical protein [Caulobacter sp. FWC26]AZS19208.1 hypothetical protein CSW63_00285 [Caulobacter sp. FWC26]